MKRREFMKFLSCLPFVGLLTKKAKPKVIVNPNHPRRITTAVEQIPENNRLLKKVKREHDFKIELSPGQIWDDIDGKFHGCTGKSSFAVILLSLDFDKEMNRDMWKCAELQSWFFGAQVVEYTEEEIRKFRYVGSIREFRR